MTTLLGAWFSQGLLVTMTLALVHPWDSPLPPVLIAFGWPLLLLPPSVRCLSR